MPVVLREQLYEYVFVNILRIVDWSVCDFETFRSTLLETIELAACWAKLPAHIWTDYAAETTSALAAKPRTLSGEEIVAVQDFVESGL